MIVTKDLTKGIFGNPNPEFLKRDKWTSNEIKMYLNLIYNVQKSKNLNIKLTPSDFDKNLSNENRFKYLNKILNGIQTKKIYVKIDEKKYRSYSLFSYLEYNKANDDIVVQFNKDLKDQIFDIKSFSKVDLDEIMKLNSYYSLKTRLMLSGVNNKNEFIVDIKRFKLEYQIPESYKLLHIQTKILNVIKKENKEVVDIYFKKKGRSATHVIIKYDMKKLNDKSVRENKIKNEFSDIILNEISNCKRNIYVSKAWNAAVEKKLNKIIAVDGEAKAIEVLKDVYVNLQQEISKSLVSYIDGILTNKKEGAIKKKTLPRKKIKVELDKTNEKRDNFIKNDDNSEKNELEIIKSDISKYLVKKKNFKLGGLIEGIETIDQAEEFILEHSIEI